MPRKTKKAHILNSATNIGSYLRSSGGGRSVKKYIENEYVFCQGDIANIVYFVLSGELHISIISTTGKEVISSIIGPNEFFGEACMAGQVKRLATVKATRATELVCIDKHAMSDMIQEVPEFSAAFLSYVLHHSMKIEADIVAQLFNSSEKRLARLLIQMTSYSDEPYPRAIRAKISQDTLSQMVGTTRSRVSYFMNRFRKLGFISYNGHIIVHKGLLNVIIHEKL